MKQQKTKPLTIANFEIDLLKKVKLHCIDRDITIRTFVIDLIKKELNKCTKK